MLWTCAKKDHCFDRPVNSTQMNVLFGNTISAVLGVCVAKLFELQPGFKIGGVYEPNWECVLVLVFCVARFARATRLG